ncbi:MAG: hypothetical protein H7289_05960 [Mucilaginibacter sp.]|nr:hypothetical protein [Mucilaginibacter sp.]
MLKSKLIILGLVAVIGTTSCGIFKKDCNCPHFGKVKTPPKAGQAPVVYASR